MITVKSINVIPENIDTITADIDFTASAEEDVTISIGQKIKDILRGRLYINEDPGAGFAQWATYTFYNKAAQHGADAFYRTSAKLVYTELEDATAVGSPNITPDDQTDFSPNDLALILGSPNEFVRLGTIANTMIAEDNLENVHSINTGLVRVSEFSGLSFFNNEDGTDIYLKVLFPGAQTVSLYLEMLVRRL